MSAPPARVRVVAAAESAAADAAAIADGIPSRALMQRAGAAAAGEIARRFRGRLRRGVLVLAGPGNNGGDAWVVARALAAAGVRCLVHEPVPARTPDAIAERALALGTVELVESEHALRALPRPGVLVDGLLGIGASGRPRAGIAGAIEHAAALRAGGTPVVALDVPSGLDATTGDDDGALAADLTLAFGTMKRGLLVSRGTAGRTLVLDIGLPEAHGREGEIGLVDAAWVSHRVPPIAAAAHKGDRRKLVVVGGAVGMAGATVLAARAAAVAGIGMTRLLVPDESLPVVQVAEPQALAASWPSRPAGHAPIEGVDDWADALLLGPGLGRSDRARALVEAALDRGRWPVVLDADALNLFEGRTDALARLLGGRRAVITPHPAEFARLAGVGVPEVLAGRFELPLELARRLGAVVLLKGVPTVVAAPDGRRLACATGTPALAAAGSGDLLAGIAATFLAQLDDPLEAAAAAAWMHGRAAELASAGRGARGVTLADVLGHLAAALGEHPRHPRYPVLAAVPRVR